MTVRKKKAAKKKVAKKKATKKAPAKKKTLVPEVITAYTLAEHDNIAFAKKSLGRPSTYDPKFCDLVIEAMAKGYSKEATAGAIGICKATLYDWISKHKEFAYAVNAGEHLSQLTWEGKAIDYCVHTKDGMRLDSRIYALQMKNRFGWADKKEIEIGPETKKKFNFSLDVKPEEIN